MLPCDGLIRWTPTHPQPCHKMVQFNFLSKAPVTFKSVSRCFRETQSNTGKKKSLLTSKKRWAGPGSYQGMLMLMVKQEGKGRWCRREGQRAKHIHHKCKCKCVSCGLSFWRCRYKTEGVTGAGGQRKARESALAAVREQKCKRRGINGIRNKGNSKMVY